MSYSYECNVICDGCDKSGIPRSVSGETKRTHKEATESAIQAAEKLNWNFENGWWYCPDCTLKQNHP